MKIHVTQNICQSTEGHVVSRTDGKAEGFFLSQPDTQLIK